MQMNRNVTACDFYKLKLIIEVSRCVLTGGAEQETSVELSLKSLVQIDISHAKPILTLTVIYYFINTKVM